MVTLLPVSPSNASTVNFDRINAAIVEAAKVSDKQDKFDLTGLLNSVSQRVLQTDFAALSAVVDGKAAASTVTALSNTVAGKASQSSVDSLTQSVANLTQSNAGKASQSALDSLTQLVNLKATQLAVDALTALVSNKLDSTQLGAIKPIFRVAPGTTIVQAKASGDTLWTDLFDYALLRGPAGLSPEIGIDPSNQTSLRWRLGTGPWNPLFDLSLLKGKDGRDGGLYSYYHPGIGTNYFTLDDAAVSTAASRELDVSGIVAGPAYRLTNQAILRSRKRSPVESTQVYLTRYVFERVSTTDPSGDAIAVGVICYDANSSVIQQVNLQLWNNPAAGTRVDVTFAFTPVEGADALPPGIVRLPAGTASVSTYTRTYGGQQDTRVRVQGLDMQGAGSGDASAAAAAAYAADANASKTASAASAAQSQASAQSAAQLILGFTTLALLNADTASTAGTVKQVVSDGANNGLWVRSTSNSPPWDKLVGLRSVPEIDRALFRIETGLVQVVARKFPSRRDYLGWNWKRYRYNVARQLIGGIDEAGFTRKWDGGGAALANYRITDPVVAPLAALATAATRFPRRRLYLPFPWTKFRYNSSGQVLGGLDLDGNTRRWDGKGSALANYPVVGGGTAASTAAAVDLSRLPLLGIGSASRGDALEVVKLGIRLVNSPPNVGYRGSSTYDNPPFDLKQDSASLQAYAQPVSRSIFSAEEFGGSSKQTLVGSYMSTIVEPGESAEDRGYGTIYRRVGNTLDPILFLIPQGYPSQVGATNPAGGYCNDVRINKLPDGRALVTCPMAGATQKRMTLYGFIINNPDTATYGNVSVGPVCILGYGWGGIISRSFGSDLLLSISTTNAYDTGTGNMLYRLSLFGENNASIFSERIGFVPNAPQDVPIDQGEVRTDFYEASLAALGRDGLICNFRTKSGSGLKGGQFWSRNFGRGRTAWWETPFRAPFPTVGSQAELTNDPDGDLVYGFNNSASERENAAIAIHRGGDVALASSWVVVTIDPRGGGSQATLSYFRPFFPTDALGRWTGLYEVWGDRGRNKVADGADPNSPGNYIGNGVRYSISKADLLAGNLSGLTITEFPTHAPA